MPSGRGRSWLGSFPLPLKPTSNGWQERGPLLQSLRNRNDILRCHWLQLEFCIILNFWRKSRGVRPGSLRDHSVFTAD
ncbi:hypothetical protein SUGI_1521840 [Cryptomeria japonica]|uniref:Uncharacterized protein n=1 Tax=Cryptomeria japonica TaxID=3369 RepID=A0AAD3NPX8_CRYJA|nr:hypothetical protein SUGI_1521840 [Cryptomeria japonica]